MQAMKQWYQSHPHLFNKRPYDRPGCDTYGLMVVPTQTASASMTDREPTAEMIRAAIQAKNLNEQDLRRYLDATRAHHSTEITKWN